MKCRFCGSGIDLREYGGEGLCLCADCELLVRRVVAFTPSNIGFQRTGQAAPSTVLDGFMEQQGETARR